jgi:hypothetical protein
MIVCDLVRLEPEMLFAHTNEWLENNFFRNGRVTGLMTPILCE